MQLYVCVIPLFGYEYVKKYYLKTFYWMVFYMFSKTFDIFLVYIVKDAVCSIWKSLWVLQKAHIKIVALFIYTNLFFLLRTLSSSAAK